MVDVKEYLKTAGGQWLRADNVQIGDKLKIIGPGEIDDETFDRSYLVLPVVLMRTGEEYQLRLGSKNVNRIMESFRETDTNKWVNRLLEVISLEQYKGLGQKGILLRGCVPSGESPPQTQPSEFQVSPQTVDVIQKSADLLEMGLPLNEGDFSILPAGVRAELLKYGFVEKRVEGDTSVYFFTKKCEAVISKA